MVKKPQNDLASFFNRPLVYYVRGRAYEGKGDTKAALENYRKLLEIWKNGDEDIPERIDALERISALEKAL